MHLPLSGFASRKLVTYWQNLQLKKGLLAERSRRLTMNAPLRQLPGRRLMARYHELLMRHILIRKGLQEGALIK